MKQVRIIISGGGTGGHIFPAIAIANALKSKCPEADILFVGATNRMEMEKVPAAGYPIVGLPVAGFNRSRPLANFKTLLLLIRSLIQARKIVKTFKPDVAVGVGGYASGPLLWAAASLKVPILIQEQNSYAGVTNKFLASKAARICVAYPGMERYFPREKILLTGNPVRQDLLGETERLRQEAIRYFQFDPSRKTWLVIGGSLGAKTINDCLFQAIDQLEASDTIQVIWQTGKYYYAQLMEQLKDRTLKQVHVYEFIQPMHLAYSVADLIISRAGAGSISEFCLLKKPVILVPSPNVAEDHQTKNALALVERDAAIMVPDAKAREQLIPTALQLSADEERLKQLSQHIFQLAQFNSAERIAEEVLKLVSSRGN